MAQSDFSFSAAYLGTPTTGSSVAHSTLSNPLYPGATELCRYWQDDGSGSRADSPKGVFAKCEVPSLVSVSKEYGISLRAWFRVPSGTSQNSIVGLRAKGAGSTQPSGYNFCIYQDKLYTDLIHVNGSAVSVDGDLSVAAAADTWHRIRMDIIPVGRYRAGDVIPGQTRPVDVLMDRVRYFTWNAADNTWTLRGERYYEITDADYVDWSDPVNAYNGFFMIHANSAGAASSASGYVDDFQVRLEEISTSARGISGIITPEAPAADPLSISDEVSPFFGRSTGEFANLYAFAALKSDGSVVTWGTSAYGGDASSTGSALTANVKQVYSTQKAFAALKQDGSVIVWGDGTSGGSAPGVDLTNVKEIFSTSAAFAALKNDGSVVTWGNATRGADSSNVAAELASGVTEIFSCFNAFAALKSDGSVVVWGDSASSNLRGADLSSGVSTIRATDFSFAALKTDGSIVSWGGSSYGGLGPDVAPSNVTSLYSNTSAFVAVNSSGQATSWGYSTFGGDSSAVAADLTSGVTNIYATARAFAAVKADGSVVAWGSSAYGGSGPAGLSGISSIVGNDHAFAAIKTDGSVVAWGGSDGGSTAGASGDLSSGVVSVTASQRAFAAVKSDGSVVVWGHSGYGGDLSSVSAEVSSGVSKVFGNLDSFAALKTDGSVVTWGNIAVPSTEVLTSLTANVVYLATPSTDDQFTP